MSWGGSKEGNELRREYGRKWVEEGVGKEMSWGGSKEGNELRRE